MASQSTTSVHDFTVKDARGNDVDLSIYKGKVLLIVNVASQWTSFWNEVLQITCPSTINSKSSPSKARRRKKIDDEELLERFHVTLDDSMMLDPLVNFDEDELLASFTKRKLDGKMRKKTAKKSSSRFDDDIGDGLLSALLCNDVPASEIEARSSPNGDP